jgi:hypothetical protein
MLQEIRDQQQAAIQSNIANQQAKDAQIAALMQELQAARSSRALPPIDFPHVLHVVRDEDVATITEDKDGGKSFAHPMDTLAVKYSTNAAAIYGHNQATLEGNAINRGFRDSEGGRLVWPGTVLKIPVSASA